MNRRGWRRRIGTRLLVNLKSGNAIAGVLWEVRGGLLTLKAAELYEVDGDGSPTKLDGEAIIAVGEVDFAQAATP